MVIGIVHERHQDLILLPKLLLLVVVLFRLESIELRFQVQPLRFKVLELFHRGFDLFLEIPHLLIILLEVPFQTLGLLLQWQQGRSATAKLCEAPGGESELSALFDASRGAVELCRNCGDLGEAEQIFARAEAVFKAAGADGTPDYAGLLMHKGILRINQGNFKEAMQLYEAAKAAYEAAGAAALPNYQELLARIRALNSEQGDGGARGWSIDSVKSLGFQEEADQQFALKARLLDKDQFSSVSKAVESLHAGEVDVPEGFCVVFSQRNHDYFLLWRAECKEEAFAALGI